MNHVFSAISIIFCVAAVLLYSLLAYGYSLAVSRIPMISNSTIPIDLNWHPPSPSWITNLTTVVNGTGIQGLQFDWSGQFQNQSDGVRYDYDYCDMPRVREQEYKIPDRKFKMVYVELIQRHHKRTPYLANGFPEEEAPWNCSDVGLIHSGQPLSSNETAASAYWSVYTSSFNPFKPPGFHGTCQFPQLTRQGLDDSLQHGLDLKGVYLDLLSLVPDYISPKVVFRVTNNVITSQVASMIISGMYADLKHRQIPIHIQPASIDSLEPKYPCQSAVSLYDEYASGSSNPAWIKHLHASRGLIAELDSISGVDPSDEGFHASFDHYFDNLSSRQCHSKALPCSVSDGSKCITETMANSVYRLGQFEYSYIYRAAPESLSAAVGSYGVWIAELAQNIRDAISGVEGPQYRHNIAHDGSIARVLAILQVDLMVWPGMGSEVVFELYSVKNKHGRFVVRVLWGGKPLRSSNPGLGVLDMVDVNVLLGYFDGLVGPGGRKVVNMCKL